MNDLFFARKKWEGLHPFSCGVEIGAQGEKEATFALGFLTSPSTRCFEVNFQMQIPCSPEQRLLLELTLPCFTSGQMMQ